jgi:hypothetical protein
MLAFLLLLLLLALWLDKGHVHSRPPVSLVPTLPRMFVRYIKAAQITFVFATLEANLTENAPLRLALDAKRVLCHSACV